jgi:hypothetical protein
MLRPMALELETEVQREIIKWRAHIERAPADRVAIEALWDGDSDGWMLTVHLVTRAEGRYATHWLGRLRHGSDFRLFEGRVPPWPESVVAQAAGNELARTLGLPFYFPSPDQPDIDCPHFWELAPGA